MYVVANGIKIRNWETECAFNCVIQSAKHELRDTRKDVTLVHMEDVFDAIFENGETAWHEYRAYMVNQLGDQFDNIVLCKKLPAYDESFFKVANYFVLPNFGDTEVSPSEYREAGSYNGYTTTVQVELNRPMTTTYAFDVAELMKKPRFVSMVSYIANHLTGSRKKALGYKAETLTANWFKSKGVKLLTLDEHPENCPCPYCVSEINVLKILMVLAAGEK